MTTLALPSSLDWRRHGKAAAIVAALALAAWWVLGLSDVAERTRNEEVEMFDLSVPPPPPPPPPPEVQPTKTEVVTAAPQAVQPDPLSTPQPASTNPPAGDLSSLLQDPTSDAGAFVGGARGQGGSGTGPLIGGTGKGGDTASRAYAELVQRQMMRHLRKRADLAATQFSFSVKVRISGSGQLEIVGLTNVRPPELEDEILTTLRGLARIDTAPPAGVPNLITLQLNQA